MLEDKEDLINALSGVDANQKITFTVNGVEHTAEVHIYGGDIEPQKVEVVLTPSH
jgi:hypothetical protein